MHSTGLLFLDVASKSVSILGQESLKYKDRVREIYQLDLSWEESEPKSVKIELNSFVLCVCIIHETNNVLAGLNDGSIVELEDNEVLRNVSDAHGRGVKCLEAWGPVHMVSGSYDGSIKIWDMVDFSLLITVSQHSDAVWSLRSCHNYLASCGMDGSKAKVVLISSPSGDVTFPPTRPCFKCKVSMAFFLQKFFLLATSSFLKKNVC